MPCFRHTSAVVAPASCSRRIPMICSSLNRLPFIVRLLSVTDSTPFWRNFRGSGHLHEKRQSAERERVEARAAIEAKRTRFTQLDVHHALDCARRFFFLELDVAAPRPERLNRPTLELLELFLITLRDHQSHLALQWPVGQGDVSILHPLALLSILCASPTKFERI